MWLVRHTLRRAEVDGLAALSWRLLDDSDLPGVAKLAGRCLSADGGQPFAASPGFVGGCYLSGETYAAFSGTHLVCVSSLRQGSDEPPVRTLRGWRRELVGSELLELLGGRRSLAVGPDRRVIVRS